MHIVKPFLFLLLCLFAFCSETVTPDMTEPPEAIKEPPFTYLALGDSYTIGESVEISERFPVQLANRLQADGVDIIDPEILATTGWTTDELSTAIKASPFRDSTFSLVSLLIGVNNQFRGYDFETYKAEFRSLLERAVKFARGNKFRVFVVSIPDYGVTPFGKSRDSEKIAREIDQYNQANKMITEEMDILYFDITPISRKAENDSELIAKDGLHPSGKMYSEWLDLIYPEIKSRLK